MHPDRHERILDWVKGPAVLDIGCASSEPHPGSRYWLHGRIRQRFPAVVGLDLNEANVRQLREQGFEEIVAGNAEGFHLPQKFDSVVAGELIEHLSNPGLFLERCAEHLEPGGRVVLSTPFPFSLFYLLYAFLKFPKTCSNLEHTCWFCPQTLAELAARHGFRVCHWELVEDYRDNVPSTRYQLFNRLVHFPLVRLVLPRRLRLNHLLLILCRA